jgi:hypothetical protein
VIPPDEEEKAMHRYLLSVWHDVPYGEVDYADPEVQRSLARAAAFTTELERQGVWVFGGTGLRDSSTATVVRSDSGDVSMTDGPYAETKEQMGGFWVIEVADFDAALEWAGKASAACERPIEVRAIEVPPTRVPPTDGG